jgi:hypothetical protein
VDLTPDPRQVIVRLDRIQTLTEELLKANGDLAEQQELSERIQREIAAAKFAVSPFILHNLS